MTTPLDVNFWLDAMKGCDSTELNAAIKAAEILLEENDNRERLLRAQLTLKLSENEGK